MCCDTDFKDVQDLKSAIFDMADSCKSLIEQHALRLHQSWLEQGHEYVDPDSLKSAAKQKMMNFAIKLWTNRVREDDDGPSSNRIREDDDGPSSDIASGEMENLSCSRKRKCSNTDISMDVGVGKKKHAA